MTKALQSIVENNVCYFNQPFEYEIRVSKHIRDARYTLTNKYSEIEKFALKNHGEAKVVKEPYIKGSNHVLRFFMVCDCVANKEFDAIIESERRFKYN